MESKTNDYNEEKNWNILDLNASNWAFDSLFKFDFPFELCEIMWYWQPSSVYIIA